MHHGVRVAVLALVFAGGACAQAPEAPPPRLTEEAVRAAAGEIARRAEARDDLDLVEGGLRADVHTWRWEKRWVSEPVGPWRTGDVAFPPPHVVDERVLVGPERTEVPWRRLRAVRARHWLLGSAVELTVDGAPEPLLLRTADAEEADALAAALDLLRRARSADPPSGADAPAAGGAGSP